MKRLVIVLCCLLWAGDCYAAGESQATLLQALTERGGTIAVKLAHDGLVQTYKNPKSRTGFRVPFTPEDPVLVFDVKNKEWAALSQEDKEALCLFVKSQIPFVRASPDKYAFISPAAPIYRNYQSSIKNMCDDCWVVDGEESSIVAGDEYYGRQKEKGSAISFSELTKNKYGTAKLVDGDSRKNNELPPLFPQYDAKTKALISNTAIDFFKRNAANSSQHEIVFIMPVAHGNQQATLVKVTFLSGRNKMLGELTLIPKKDGGYSVAEAKQHKRPE